MKIINEKNIESYLNSMYIWEINMIHVGVGISENPTRNWAL